MDRTEEAGPGAPILNMGIDPIHVKTLPALAHPLLIVGFDGWGNALDISKAMATYLVRKLEAKPFATINPDLFYRYDENRPRVNIQNGDLKEIAPPGGSFYFVGNKADERDLVVLIAGEPSLRWFQFTESLYELCGQLGVEMVITLGSMYDNVLHTDTVISGLASSKALLSMLEEKGVVPVNYHGPSAIHSTIQSEGAKRGFQCISLWCHCPYYLQGTTHFGLLAHLGALLSTLGGFALDTQELEVSWKELSKQIQGLIEKNPELQNMINELRKARVRGSWANVRGSVGKDDKIIPLSDFLKPKS